MRLGGSWFFGHSFSGNFQETHSIALAFLVINIGCSVALLGPVKNNCRNIELGFNADRAKLTI